MTTIYTFFLTIILGSLSGYTYADDKKDREEKEKHEKKNLCFDFSKPIKAPLKEPPALNPKHDEGDSGTLPSPKDGIWSDLRGVVDAPIQKVYTLLLDPYTIKDPERVSVKLHPQKQPGYKDFQHLGLKVSSIVSVEWNEDWGFVIADGTDAKPKKIVISYQKTKGTKYISHLCGSIVLTALSPHQTDVYLYEEVDAFGKRSPRQTLEGHRGTLATLRGEKDKDKKEKEEKENKDKEKEKENEKKDKKGSKD